MSSSASGCRGSTAFTAAVARGLHKLTAYKDEYEVARLHLEWLATVAPGSKVKFQLHPPVLRALGRKRKIGFGRSFVPMLRLLRRARVLRGTPLDLFGLPEVRRIERQLPGEYLELVTLAGERLSPDTIESPSRPHRCQSWSAATSRSSSMGSSGSARNRLSCQPASRSRSR